MPVNESAKQRLPYPYNQDLSTVLRRLDRRTPFSRQRLANDPVTAAYIAAGMRLVQRHLGPDAERVLADPEDENSVGRPLLAFLSQRAVAAEVANNPDPFPRSGSTSTLRSTWRSHSDFIADLLRFGLWSAHRPAARDGRISTESERLIEGPDFVDVAHKLCYYDMTALISGLTFRLELVATAVAEDDRAIQEAVAESHSGGIAPWKQLYHETLRARGLQFRSGVSLDQFTEILSALASGFALYGIARPDALTVDHYEKRSLFGTAVLALMLGCVEPVGASEGITVEEAVNDLVYGPQQGSDMPKPPDPREGREIARRMPH